MKTITATAKGIAINYEDSNKSTFIYYEQTSAIIKEQNNYFEMNAIQRSMFRRLMYGINAYSSEEIQTMTEIIKYSIKKDHTKAIEVVNKMKYEKYYGDYNKLLSAIFPKIKLSFYKDGQDFPTPSLKELKITTSDIINAWINEKLLPLNFYQITQESLTL